MGTFKSYLMQAIGCMTSILLLSTSAAAAPSKTSAPSSRIIVTTQAGVDASAVRSAAESVGGKFKRVGSGSIYFIDLGKGSSIDGAVRHLRANPSFKSVELDEMIEPNFTANDPYLTGSWHISKIGARSTWGTTRGQGVIIAVLDSGVDARHADLAGNLVPGFNFFNGNADTTDRRGHGTEVAGIAAAAAGNGIGVAGVANLARIMPLRITNDTGQSQSSAVIEALDFAARNGARIANISYSVAGNQSVRAAALAFKQAGGLVFVAAGNSNLNPGYTASTSMIVVSSTTKSDLKSSFSNFGPFVTLAAPGSGIYTTKRLGGYISRSGTSYAAPQAAGVAALVMSVNPRLTSTQVEQILIQSSVDLGAPGRDFTFGYGRISAEAAVRLALSASTDQLDGSPPSVGISTPAPSSVLSGTAAIGVRTDDNVGVVKVELLLNGVRHQTSTRAPFDFSLNTLQITNGTVALQAKAYDAAGHSSTSAPVSVLVANAPAAPPPAQVVSQPPQQQVIASPQVQTTSTQQVPATSQSTQILAPAAVQTTR